MWDPQFLYLTLSLARLRPEVFPLLAPVLQNNVLAPVHVDQINDWTSTNWLRILEIIKWKRLYRCRFYWGALSSKHGVSPKETLLLSVRSFCAQCSLPSSVA